jgi:hypothetical protein
VTQPALQTGKPESSATPKRSVVRKNQLARRSMTPPPAHSGWVTTGRTDRREVESSSAVASIAENSNWG